MFTSEDLSHLNSMQSLPQPLPPHMPLAGIASALAIAAPLRMSRWFDFGGPATRSTRGSLGSTALCLACVAAG